MVTRPELTPQFHRRAAAFYKLLQAAPRDRQVAPLGQPFAFRTHHGRVRKENQDTAIVVTGRRTESSSPFLGALLCDGVGGLEEGADAAARAAAWAAAGFADADQLTPDERMEWALNLANWAVFSQFGGRAGTVLVAALLEEQDTIIGWVGDARVYGLKQGRQPELLTRDDTIAAEIARLGGAAPDPMDTLLQAIGHRSEVTPHVLRVGQDYAALLLVSDGVHRIEPVALDWVCRHARSLADLADRLVAAAAWEGGSDNATGIALQLGRKPVLEEDGQMLCAWVEAQPRIWQVEALDSRRSIGHPQARIDVAQVPEPKGPRLPGTRNRKRNSDPRADGAASRQKRPEQTPLRIELGGRSEEKP